MKNWNLLLGLSISLSLACGNISYAIQIVPPIPIGAEETQAPEHVEYKPGHIGATTAPTVAGPEQSTSEHLGPGGSAPGNSAPGSSIPETTKAPANQTSEVPNTVSPETKLPEPAKSVSEPTIQAQGAVLMDVSTGRVLYGKNQNTQYYPASITKLMTALLVIEQCSLDDTVKFSATATTNLEAGSVTINLIEGDKLTVRQSLYALLLKSANEVANGLAEHVDGSISKFANRMNARAKTLGCTNTNFANPNGLNNSNHYTTPHDMALIASEAFKNKTLCTVASTLTYNVPATKRSAAKTITMGHKMLYPSDSRYYPGIVGGKTGYTSLAGNTLVTCAERDGVRLVAVVMKGKSTQYTDTKALLDYGFNHLEYLGLAGGNQTASAGWNQNHNKAWYYVMPNGEWAKNKWIQTNDKWYYLGADGIMMTSTTTPDGYVVDKAGVWITK